METNIIYNENYEQMKKVEFDPGGLDNPKDKKLNIFIMNEDELNEFDNISIEDFSDLKVFYKSLKKAKNKRKKTF